MEFENLSKSWDYTVNKAIKPNMLTLHELGELIRHLGLELRLRPVAEHPVPSKKQLKKNVILIGFGKTPRRR
jgi:hypothetical protein